MNQVTINLFWTEYMSTGGILNRKLVSGVGMCVLRKRASCLVLITLLPRTCSAHSDPTPGSRAPVSPAMSDRSTQRLMKLQKSHIQLADLLPVTSWLPEPQNHLPAGTGTPARGLQAPPKCPLSAIKTFVKEDLMLVL